MKPTIYVANRCHQCGLVKDFVKRSGVETDIYNVDLSAAKPPMQIFIYPALFVDSKLIAYGEDIISYFKEQLINS